MSIDVAIRPIVGLDRIIAWKSSAIQWLLAELDLDVVLPVNARGVDRRLTR